MKLLSVVGARPNFMKIAPIAEAVKQHNARSSPEIDHIIVHTGQHYDERMSELFFRDLGIPRPAMNLGIGSASHAVQTAEIMRRFEPVLLDIRPDYLIVVGDVNSTIACALVASKLGVKIVHVEAGLRSFDRSMPEEINRILTDCISEILFVTEPSGIKNLLAEGVSSEKIHMVGNVMIDSLLKHLPQAEKQSTVIKDLGLFGTDQRPVPYGVVTLHRPSNVDNPDQLRSIIGTLNTISEKVQLVFPIHPRAKANISVLDVELSPNIHVTQSLGYLDFLKLTANAQLVLTDSGGIQEETTILGVPCLTLRENTERPVTVNQGTNTIVGTSRESILREAWKILENRPQKGGRPDLWDGRAGERIVKVLIEMWANSGVVSEISQHKTMSR